MKKPNSFPEFKKLILDMENRERYCFQMGNRTLEIYCTIKFNSNGTPYNYNFQYMYNSEIKPVNRLKKYLTNDLLIEIYDKIDEE